MIPEHLQRIRIPGLSDQWFDFRTTGTVVNGVKYEGGIGASEIGSLCDYDEYCPKAEVYMNKVGTFRTESIDNEATIQGREMEPLIVNRWRAWEPQSEKPYLKYGEYLSTGNEKHLYREAKLEKAYVVNPKYPQLFVSLDAYIPVGGVNQITGEVLDHVCPLECKTIARYAAKSYRNGYPPKYNWQIQQQMLVLEADYGEIAILEDGRHFKAIPIEKNERMQEDIIRVSEDFWKNRVLPARDALKTYYDAKAAQDNALAERAMKFISELEPDPEGSDRYAEIKKEQYTEKFPSIKGTKSLFDLAKRYDRAHKFQKAFDDEKKKVRGQFLNELSNTQSREIEFGDHGHVKFTKDMKITVKVKKGGIEEDEVNVLLKQAKL